MFQLFNPLMYSLIVLSLVAFAVYGVNYTETDLITETEEGYGDHNYFEETPNGSKSISYGSSGRLRVEYNLSSEVIEELNLHVNIYLPVNITLDYQLGFILNYEQISFDLTSLQKSSYKANETEYNIYAQYSGKLLTNLIDTIEIAIDLELSFIYNSSEYESNLGFSSIFDIFHHRSFLITGWLTTGLALILIGSILVFPDQFSTSEKSLGLLFFSYLLIGVMIIFMTRSNISDYHGIYFIILSSLSPLLVDRLPNRIMSLHEPDIKNLSVNDHSVIREKKDKLYDKIQKHNLANRKIRKVIAYRTIGLLFIIILPSFYLAYFIIYLVTVMLSHYSISLM